MFLKIGWLTVKSPISELNLPEGGSKPQYLISTLSAAGSQDRRRHHRRPILAAAGRGIAMGGGSDAAAPEPKHFTSITAGTTPEIGSRVEWKR
jgi:hypothetical protein